MHNIRKIGIRILLILAVLFVYEEVAEFLYRPYDETTVYINREQEEMDGTIETLLCGTSTTQRGIDPYIIDKELETISFNSASSMQPIDGTYELIRDVAESNPVETVILGVSPDPMKKKQVNTKFKSRLYDRLKGAGSKLNYLLRGCSVDEWPYMILYSARVENYFDSLLIQENVDNKLSKEYKSGEINKGNYKGKGMMAIKKTFDAEQIEYLKKGNSKFKVEHVKEHNLEYLTKIAKYCEENQIELILVYIPLTGTKIESYRDISTIHDFYAEFAKEQDAVFWDFNYYKDLKTLFTNDKFEDEKHLNKDGAKVFSEELTNIYYRYHMGEDIGKYFCDTCPYYLESGVVGK